MSNINLDTKELLSLLDITPSSHNLMLVGAHGIGKSEILTDYYTEKGMRVVPLFLGQMSDPGDLLGLPFKDSVTGRTNFMPPYWFPTDGQPIVLFLDELNRARPEMLQTVMDLALNRKLAGRMLPEGSRVISAVNAGDEYQLTDLDPALVSRFNIVQFRPTVQDWLLWAGKSGIDHRVISFIEGNHLWLDRDPDYKEGSDTGLDKTPDRRAWKRVSDLIKGRDDLTGVLPKAVAGAVGPKAAAAFIENIANRHVLSGRDVLYHFTKHRKTLSGYDLHQIGVVNDGIYRCLEVEKVKEADILKVSKNLDDYFTWLSNDCKEAAAHFANLYIGQTCQHAVAFMAKNCGMLTNSMISYISGIK